MKFTKCVINTCWLVINFPICPTNIAIKNKSKGLWVVITLNELNRVQLSNFIPIVILVLLVMRHKRSDDVRKGMAIEEGDFVNQGDRGEFGHL